MKIKALGSRYSKSIQKPIVYTIEECSACNLKTKREFKLGDYVFKEVGECSKCKGKTTISMIFSEQLKKSK
jgi:hypothetical protein